MKMGGNYLHEFSNAYLNVMLNGTSDRNVDIFSSECHHVPANAFQMKTCE